MSEDNDPIIGTDADAEPTKAEAKAAVKEEKAAAKEAKAAEAEAEGKSTVTSAVRDVTGTDEAKAEYAEGNPDFKG